MQPLPFDTLQGKYSVIEELGRGASGICYHIVTKETAQHYALKKIPLHLIEPQKLNNQIQILNSISHPHLIKLRQSYISKDYLYLAFDYNQEKDLQKLIKEREKSNSYFDEVLIWTFLRRMLEALQYLHQKNIIHRDIKPSNVFVNLNDNTLQIGDLGTAKIAERENYSRIGTPLYLPPEIIKYESYNEKIDIWSLGVTLYQIAALKPPFHHHNFLKLAQLISYEEPAYPSHFSKRLVMCIQEMLKKDPIQRPSCTQLLQTYFTSMPQPTPQESAKSIPPEQSSFTGEEKEEDWKVQLVSVIFPNNAELEKHSSRRTTFCRNSIQDDQSLKFQSKKSINRQSIKKFTSLKEDEIKQQTCNRSQLEDGDHTIVLQVNPNDFNNFCGYYRQSPRPSRIHFNPDGLGAHLLKMGRKSSLFKHSQPNEPPQLYSQFKTNCHLNKQNEKTVKVTTHRRQQSGICAKQRHGELMSNLRPSRHERQLQLQPSSQIQRPQLIIIDRKPLLYPLTEI